MAWVYHQKGELRRAISLMRRAYPQFLAAGGDELPAEMLQVIFPLTYWDAIRQERRRPTISIHISSPRWSRRNRRSIRASSRSRMPGG